MIASLRSRVRITAVGSALPSRVVTNAELAERLDTTDEWIRSRTGIAERRVAADDEFASDLALRAADEALERSGLAPADVDLVVCATSTPDAYFPSVAAIVADHIGAHSAAAFDLSAACTGYVYAHVCAAAHLDAGIGRCALVIGAETMSRIVDWDDRATCILFGDAAAATVLCASDTTDAVLGIELGADGSRSDQLVASALRGGPSPLTMNGREVFKFATRVMVDSVGRVLDATGLGVSDVDWYVPHQANSRIIDHAVRRLGLDAQRVLVNVERYGNTSAASIPLCLDEAWRDGRLQPGNRIMMVGFGGGLTWGTCLTQWEAPAAPPRGDHA